MKLFGEKIQKKLKSVSGASFVEMLLVVLLLLLVSDGMTSTVSLAIAQYQKSMRNSQAKVLSSTLMTIISNELAYTESIQVEGGQLVSFLSWNYSSAAGLSRWEIEEPSENGYGYLTLGGSSVLAKSAYTNGLLVKIDSITYNQDTYCFQVILNIGYKGKEYLKRTFDVVNVNQPVPESPTPTPAPA